MKLCFPISPRTIVISRYMLYVSSLIVIDFNE